MTEFFKFTEEPQLSKPSLIVGWHNDAGGVSANVIAYLNEKIRSTSFCTMEPAAFFSLGGVAVHDDVARFPQSKFYCGRRTDLVIFEGWEPQFERYKFLNAILDVAEHPCGVTDLSTLGGTVSSIAHTSDRRILAVFNGRRTQEAMRGYGLDDMNWQGPPALSSYLIWLARKRDIPAMSLWLEIPFYLAAGVDLQAIRTALWFLQRRFDLDLDLPALDEGVNDQHAKIAELRDQEPQIDRSIAMLEGGVSLDEQQQLELTRTVTEYLEESG